MGCLFPSCSLFLFSSFGCCLKIIILRLVWSTRCHGRLTQKMENDGNNRQPRARGLCSIDPIALIKVVYREYTLSNDGWLLVIMQQPRNITPLICGVLTQPLRAILAWLTPQRRTKKKYAAPLDHPRGTFLKGGMRKKKYWLGVDWCKKDTYGIRSKEERGSSMSVITGLPCPADLQDKVREHKWKDQD